MDVRNFRADGQGRLLALIFLLAAGLACPDASRGEDRTSVPEPTHRGGSGPEAKTPSTLRYEGKPIAGSRITVGLDGPPESGARYTWSQVEGPPVTLGNPEGPKIQFTVPTGAQSLSFLLSIHDHQGARQAQVVIPVEPPAPRPTTDPAIPRAEAGDDQVALVGHRLTLNGTQSTPRGRVAFRWFPIAGPKVDDAVREGGYYSFTPTSAGTYRFGLVVAASVANQVAISDVDEIVVTVGEFPAGLAEGLLAPIPVAAIDQMLQGPGAPAGRGTLEQSAAIFEAIAGRCALYTNFAELTSELMRRIDSVIPTDPNWRQFWAQAVFAPLTQHLASEMLATGIDLRGGQGQHQKLKPHQRERLAQLFKTYARQFHARAQID